MNVYEQYKVYLKEREERLGKHKDYNPVDEIDCKAFLDKEIETFLRVLMHDRELSYVNKRLEKAVLIRQQL